MSPPQGIPQDEAPLARPAFSNRRCAPTLAAPTRRARMTRRVTAASSSAGLREGTLGLRPARMLSLGTTYDLINTAIFLPSGGSGRLRQELVDALEITPGERVLELGCGSGQVTARLLDAGARVVAVDALTAMIDAARRRAPQATFVHGDAFQRRRRRRLSSRGPLVRLAQLRHHRPAPLAAASTRRPARRRNDRRSRVGAATVCRSRCAVARLPSSPGAVAIGRSDPRRRARGGLRCRRPRRQIAKAHVARGRRSSRSPNAANAHLVQAAGFGARSRSPCTSSMSSRETMSPPRDHASS